MAALNESYSLPAVASPVDAEGERTSRCPDTLKLVEVAIRDRARHG